MNRMMLIILTLFSCTQPLLAMDMPQQYEKSLQIGERNFSLAANYEFIQDNYLPFYKETLATNLQELDLKNDVYTYGPERVLTAFFITFFTYISTLCTYPAIYANRYNGDLNELPHDEKAAFFPVCFAHQVLDDFVLEKYFQREGLKEAIIRSKAIYKNNIQTFLELQDYNFEQKFENNDNTWNVTFFNFESSLLFFCNDTFSELFFASYNYLLKALPKKLGKNPFTSTRKRKELCKQIKSIKNNFSDKEEYYLRPWNDYIENFTYNKNQRQYAKRVIKFYLIKSDPKSVFHEQNDIFLHILFMIKKIWHNLDEASTSSCAMTSAPAQPALTTKPKIISPDLKEDTPLEQDQPSQVNQPAKVAKKKKLFPRISKRSFPKK